jgi:hypothetical protein
MPPAPRRISTSCGLELDGQGVFDAQVARAMDAADKGHAGLLAAAPAAGRRGAGCLPAGGESVVRQRQVAAHRRARAVGVVRGDGVDHGLVLGDGQLPAVAVLEVAAQLREQRVVALVVEVGDDACQHRVARGLDDAHVEQAVAHRGQLPLVDLLLHHAMASRRPRTCAAFIVRGRACGQFAFDDLARADGLQRRLGRDRRRAGRRLLAHVDARTHAHLDQALRPRARSAPRAPTAATRPAAAPVRARPAAACRRELALLDQRAHLVGDLPVQALGLDGLQRHGGGQAGGGGRRWPSGLTS